MFTGIVEACVPVLDVERRGSGARLVLPVPGLDGWDSAEGDSVAVAGTCLTVAQLVQRDSAPGGRAMAFDLSAETLERTWFGSLVPGRRVNLERALRLGDRLDGHMVAGHVDGGGWIVAVEPSGDGGKRFSIEVDPGLERYLIEKGSITVDGVSLTVVGPREQRFDVAVIPVTLERTQLGQAEVGQRVNIEVDMVGKWIERLLPPAR